ncbi:MAG TPA: FAD-dependent oxidoreductase [Thermoanaerobaculia bacterium]|nr:FAD-dependent oxidoreductase [Thermoanaerobaculia bacterium]
MSVSVAVVGAGVSGLTTAVTLAERGFAPRVFAALPAEQATSGAAAAIWYPYEAEPAELVTWWSLITYGRLLALHREENAGVSLLELRTFSRSDGIAVPAWAAAIGYRTLPARPPYRSGFSITAPLMDTPLYLPWLRRRLLDLGGSLHEATLDRLEDADPRCPVVVNCTGYGARALVPDPGLEAHRGQVAVVEPIDLPYALVCDDDPLTYVIPRANDCILGGINEASERTAIDEAITTNIIDECTRVLGSPQRLRESRVGLRPYRAAGVRLEAATLRDGRTVVHNYGHGGSGFTLSWGCAHKAAELVSGAVSS